MEEVVGRLKVVLFHNDDNLYSVIKIKVNDETDSKYLTLTGNFPIPNDTTDYKYRGEYTTHPRYGAQFIVSEYEELLPNSEEAIIKYLSSPLFPKIGVKTATKIYNELGKNTIEIIKRNPEVLDYLVSDEQKNIIVSKLSEDSYFDEAVKEFVTQGLSLKMLLKIQSVYQEKMIQVIKENPYKLVEEIDGIDTAVTSHTDGTATLTLSKDVSSSTLKTVIEDAGYKFIG
jgi:exodeoxyribonuclease V alpha subunit